MKIIAFGRSKNGGEFKFGCQQQQEWKWKWSWLLASDFFIVSLSSVLPWPTLVPWSWHWLVFASFPPTHTDSADKHQNLISLTLLILSREVSREWFWPRRKWWQLWRQIQCHFCIQPLFFIHLHDADRWVKWMKAGRLKQQLMIWTSRDGLSWCRSDFRSSLESGAQATVVGAERNRTAFILTKMTLGLKKKLVTWYTIRAAGDRRRWIQSGSGGRVARMGQFSATNFGELP